MIPLHRIPDKRDGEKIIKHLRRHWFIFLRIFLAYALLFAIPLAMYYFLFLFAPVLIDSEINRIILTVLSLSYYLMMLVFVFTIWTEKYLDVWTLTTERIISREQIGLFNRVVSDLELSRIQDVTVEQRGFWATMLDYGDVYVQSAGEVERFNFEQVGRPYRIAKLIQNLNEQAHHAHYPAV